MQQLTDWLLTTLTSMYVSMEKQLQNEIFVQVSKLHPGITLPEVIAGLSVLHVVNGSLTIIFFKGTAVLELDPPEHSIVGTSIYTSRKMRRLVP